MFRARHESVLKMVADGLVFRPNVFGKHKLHFSRLIEGPKSKKAIPCAGLQRIAQRNEFRSGNGGYPRHSGFHGDFGLASRFAGAPAQPEGAPALVPRP
jgi:hypothetical protein